MNPDAVATRKDIDEIIGIVRAFMDDMHEQLEHVDSRLNRVDSHLNKIDSRLDKIEKKTEPSNASINNRLTKVETDTALLKKVVTL